MTGKGGIVEIQGTAEGMPFSEEEFATLMALAKKGITRLVEPAADGGGVRPRCTPFRHPRIRALRDRPRRRGSVLPRRARAGADRQGRGPARLFPLRAGRAAALQRRGDEGQPPPDAKLPVPPHGTVGEGHLCFAATRGRDRRVEDGARRGAASRSRPISNGLQAAARSISATRPAIRSNSPNRRIWGLVMQPLEGTKIVVASHNDGKLQRVRRSDGAVRPGGEVGQGIRPAGAGRDRHDLRGECLHQGSCGGARQPACRRCRTIPA